MLKVYNKLLKEFGKQHWWPSITKSKFEICVGAILTQNTNWQNVEKAIDNLIKNRMLTKEAIKNANISRLSALIRSSGYYKQKARKLKIFAGFDGEITRENLLSLWGIGPETADSMLLYAYNKPYFVVDAYTKRIFERLGMLNGNEDYEEIRKLFEKNLPKDVKIYKEFHALIVELGKKYCKKTPDCKNCPLKSDCGHAIKHK
ncbi:MAG: endonuclease [Candidatus Aenigmarchaeota archaeon]|nr:endonuclease [Candidatus Aenigmarchaeota archaeon]